MPPTEVLSSIAEYFGNHALPCALISKSIKPWSMYTSAASICRNKELAAWVIEQFAHSPSDLDRILAGAACNGFEMIKFIWTELVPGKHLPSRMGYVVGLCASRCDLDSIEFLLNDPYGNGSEYPDMWDLCAKYIYGADQCGVTDMVPGLERLCKILQPEFCGIYGDCATTAALVVNNKAAFQFLVGELECFPPDISDLYEYGDFETRLEDFTDGIECPVYIQYIQLH